MAMDQRGVRKAAILLLAVGEETAGNVLQQMDDFEIRDLSREMVEMGAISGEEMDEVLESFVEEMVGGGGDIMGGWTAAERFLGSVMGEDKVKALMEEMRGPAGRTVWEKLSNVSEDILANYLRNEYPQTVAVIMSKVKPAHAAKVLANLPEDLAMEVIERMLLIDNISRDVIENVETSLRTEFMRNLAAKNKRDSHEVMAEVFNNFDRANEAKFMELLEQRSQEDADKIRALMFTFDDLSKTDDKGLQEILREVEKDRLALALKGCQEGLRERFFKNMSERAAKILAEDMEAMGPVRVREVDEAQAEIVTVAKNLIDQGRVVIAEEGGEDDYI